MRPWRPAALIWLTVSSAPEHGRRPRSRLPPHEQRDRCSTPDARRASRHDGDGVTDLHYSRASGAWYSRHIAGYVAANSPADQSSWKPIDSQPGRPHELGRPTDHQGRTPTVPGGNAFRAGYDVPFTLREEFRSSECSVLVDMSI